LFVSQIDPIKVAAALNMKNPKSVGNKVGQMKKKFGFSISCSSKATASGSGSGDAGASATSGPVVPKTPNNNRVTKKATATKKAPPKGSKGGKKGKKDESEDEVDQAVVPAAESGAEDEDAMVSSPLAVKELSTPELVEAVFGKADPDEEEDGEDA
jgi:hypothetical protein